MGTSQRRRGLVSGLAPTPLSGRLVRYRRHALMPVGRVLVGPAEPERGRLGDRRTIGGRSVSALNGVALAVIFGGCIRVQIPASSSFASVWPKAKVKRKR